MGPVLLLLFITVPLIEIAVFIQVGGWIGLWPTLALILLTAVLGSWQLRRQGMATLARARAQLDRGEIPAAELFDGMCLLGAGALLLTPGFVTDLAGASLFLAPVRGWLRRRLGSRLVKTGGAARTRVFVDGEEMRPGAGSDFGRGAAADPHSRWGRPAAAPPGTIEGEWTELSDEPPAPTGSEKLSGPENDGEEGRPGRDGADR